MKQICIEKSPDKLDCDWIVYFDYPWIKVLIGGGTGFKKRTFIGNINIHKEITSLSEKEAYKKYKKLGWKYWNYYKDKLI